MAPHPPPCSANEVLWGNQCYPKIDTFRIERVGADYKFFFEEIPGDLLHGLADKAGDKANLHVKKVGSAFEVTITSVPHGDATDLLKQLRPNDLNFKLPD
jgi:hypothetical protein